MFRRGDRVGDYEIVAKLKSGGMATLFLGRRLGVEGFSRHVAIKVVHEHLASDPTFVQMFVDEALLSAKIQHPNVVHVEELRQLDGRHFLVMEYVHGCALSALLRELAAQGRTVAPELATYIAVAVAEGLHAAHETRGPDGQPLGVVHRDVSPQNVLLAYRGHVKLIDFGVAKAAGRAQQTTGASLKGKIGYMAPEQAFGRSVDRRTDVYALGLILWEMLTARRAFSADNDFALLEQVRDPRLPDASVYNPAVPAALDEVIRGAIAPDPRGRVQTALELRKALARAMPGALALDASDLEKLLSAVMSDEMAAEREALPHSVSGLVSQPVIPAAGAEAEQVLNALTISAVGSGRTALAPSDPPLRSGASGDGIERTSLLPDAQPSPPPLDPPAPDREAPRRSPALIAASAGLAFLLLVGGGMFAAWWLRPTPPEMTATELGPDEPAQTPTAAAAPAEPTDEGGSETSTTSEAAGDEAAASGEHVSEQPQAARDESTGERDEAASADAPSAGTPSANAPSADTPSADTPSDDTPRADEPSSSERVRPARRPDRARRRRPPRRRGPAQDDLSGIPLADEF